MKDTYLLSAHFLREEARCKDGTALPDQYLANAETLAREILEPVRLRWGGPLVVVSWYRTPEHNRKVSGAPGSTHLTAEGVDIAPKDPRDSLDLHDLVRELHAGKKLPRLGGLGRYPRWVHCDIRKAKDGHLRRWLGGGFGAER